MRPTPPSRRAGLGRLGRTLQLATVRTPRGGTMEGKAGGAGVLMIQQAPPWWHSCAIIASPPPLGFLSSFVLPCV